MDESKKRDFVLKMGKRQPFAKGGAVKRESMSAGGAITGAMSGAATGAAVGSVVPGLGTAVGAIVGGVGGLISGIFSGGDDPKPPNITNPVTGEQITDATGHVVASQQQLATFAQMIQGVHGADVQAKVMGQFQDIAAGKGPNPAQTMLNQQTGQNVAQTSALMAGQRGAASNVGLIARQAGQEGAQIQQQAVGQGATMQAEQSLNALGASANIAGQLVGEHQAALDASGSIAVNNQSNVLGAASNYNTAVTSGQGNVNDNKSAQQGQVLKAVVPIGMGALSGAGAANVYSSMPSGPAATMDNVNSGAFSNSLKQPKMGSSSGFAHGGEVLEGPHPSHVANYLHLFKGGKVPAKVSPGEIYLSPDKVEQVLSGKNPLKIGDRIPGKAKARGDSTKNDTVSRDLDEGGVVIPRSHVMNEEKAALFVHRAMAKKGRR